jgi:hypothetical protein
VDGLPRPEAAYALLIGAGEFEDAACYGPLPGAYRSVARLAELVQAPDGDHAMWRLPEDRVDVLGPAVTADEARRALQRAVSRPGLEALLVVIACQANRYADDGQFPAGQFPQGLHLALTNSTWDLPGSHWHADEIRRVLAQAAARVRHIVLVVDAGQADTGPGEPGSAGGAAGESGQLSVPGVVTMTATGYRPGAAGAGWTPLLGALIQSIEAGVRSYRQPLTALDVFEAASRRLAAARRMSPEVPEAWASGPGRSDVPLCLNQQYIRPLRPAAPESGRAAAGEFTDAAECFSAIRALHQRRDDGLIPGVIDRFCGRADVPPDEAAELVARLAASEFSAYRPYAYEASCAGRPAEGIAGLVHCLHLNGEPVSVPMLASSLRQRPGRLLLGAYEALVTGRCGPCGAAAEALSAQVVADPALAASVLPVWR